MRPSGIIWLKISKSGRLPFKRTTLLEFIFNCCTEICANLSQTCYNQCCHFGGVDGFGENLNGENLKRVEIPVQRMFIFKTVKAQAGICMWGEVVVSMESLQELFGVKTV